MKRNIAVQEGVGRTRALKKSTVVAISLMGSLGGLLLAIGMCMCLLPAWNAFLPGVLPGVIGAVTLLAIWLVYRAGAGKGMPHFTGLHVLALLLALAGAVALGIGLVQCLQMVTPWGLGVGIVGLVLLLAALLLGRAAAGKQPIPFQGRTVLAVAIGVAGALVLGAGMCMVMVVGSDLLIPGICVGAAGLLVCVLNGALRLAR